MNFWQHIRPKPPVALTERHQVGWCVEMLCDVQQHLIRQFVQGAACQPEVYASKAVVKSLTARHFRHVSPSELDVSGKQLTMAWATNFCWSSK